MNTGFAELFELAGTYEPSFVAVVSVNDGAHTKDWENDPFFARAALFSEVFNPHDQAGMRRGWIALSGAFFMLNIFLSRGISGSDDVDKCIRLIAMIICDYGHRYYGREEDWSSNFMYWYIVHALDVIVRCPADARYFESGDSERAQIVDQNCRLFGGVVSAEFLDSFVPEEKKFELEDDTKHKEIWGHFSWYYSVGSITRRFFAVYPCDSEEEAMERLTGYFRVEVA